MSSSNKIKIVALFGKSAAGKDTVQKELLKQGDFHKIVSCTTRFPREGEVDGIDYHFLTHKGFTEDLFENKFIEALEFNGWFYGTKIEDLNKEKINIGIFTPEGILCLIDSEYSCNLSILPIYIECPDKIRLMRALDREEDPNIGEICRRYEADEKDFNIIDYYFRSVRNDNEPTALKDSVQKILDYTKAFFVQDK